MSENFKFGLFATVCIGILFVLIVALSLWRNAEECGQQWEHSGLKSRWGWPEGCMVQRKDGTWIPAKAIRDLQP